MRFGINTFLFSSPFSTRTARLFPKFRSWGFESVEIPVEEPALVNPKAVRRRLDEERLVAGSLCACLGPSRDLRGTARQQRTASDYIRTLIDYAVDLGSSVVVGPVYSAVGRAESYSASERRLHWKTVVAHLRELSRYASDRGCAIAVEPLNRFETDFINTVDQALELIDDVGSPALKLHLDTFHMNIEEKSLPVAIRKAGPALAHFHACGSDRGTPGNDHTDWQGIAAALKEIGYQGDVVIESFTAEVKTIARAAAIWRRIEPSREEIAVKGLVFLRSVLL